MSRPKIIELTRTCFLCPEQWEGITEHGESVYARERHDCVRVELNDTIIYQGEGGTAIDALAELFELPPLDEWKEEN